MLSTVKSWTLQNKLFILFCSFSFFFTFKPSEAFLVVLYTSKGLTGEQVYQDIFPVWTYSYFVALILAGVFTEITKQYKIFLIFGLFGNLATLLILDFSDNFFLLQIGEVTIAIYTTVYVIFSAYLFVTIPKFQYQKIASYTKSAYLIGNVGGAIFGQLLIDAKYPVVYTFYISSCISLITIIHSFFFPNPNQEQTNSRINDEEALIVDPPLRSIDLKFTLKQIFLNFKNILVLKYFIYATFTICIHFLALTYWQSLVLKTNSSVIFNGYGYAGAYGGASLVALIPPKIEEFLGKKINLITIFWPFCTATLLSIMGLVSKFVNEDIALIIVYICLILYNMFFEFLAPVIGVQIAKRLNSECYVAVFALNTVFALFLQSIIQFIVGKHGLNISISNQFVVFGFVLYILAFLMIFFTILGSFSKKSDAKN